ncbi:acyl-CoA dehydrogenase family protein, partial [Escherichia coli]
PNAGSDLASLQTRADVDGDDYIINGQKIWTSMANFADWIFCLVRTDFSAKKHDGISFILFDMTSKGVSTKPILL